MTAGSRATPLGYQIWPIELEYKSNEVVYLAFHHLVRLIQLQMTAGMLLDLEKPESWPADLVEFLEAHYGLILGWERQSYDNTPITVTGRSFDKAIAGICPILEKYFLRGWHCTKLTETEIANIEAHGMQMQNLAVLKGRLDALEVNGLVTRKIADRLRSENQADDKNRANMIWFCFFPPHIGGQSGIERFFCSWGGEALYNSHEDDPETGPVLAAIGVPCLVETDVPIKGLKNSIGLAMKVMRRYLISRGYETIEPVDHEDRVVEPIRKANIRRIIRFPEQDFVKLTKCDKWRPPLAVLSATCSSLGAGSENGATKLAFATARLTVCAKQVQPSLPTMARRRIN